MKVSARTRFWARYRLGVCIDQELLVKAQVLLPGLAGAADDTDELATGDPRNAKKQPAIIAVVAFVGVPAVGREVVR